ncbi:hypothetical protein ACFL4T_01640 [candidate division KSB1 bacterium]
MSNKNIILKNPIIIGSCGLTVSLDNWKEYAKAGVGAVVTKSIALKPNRIVGINHESIGGFLVNKEGASDKSVQEFIENVNSFLKSEFAANTQLILSLVGFIKGDKPDFIKYLNGIKNLTKELQSGIFAKNISIELNTNKTIKSGSTMQKIGHRSEMVFELAKTATQIWNGPVIVKLLYTENENLLREVIASACDGGADMISLINSVPANKIEEIPKGKSDFNASGKRIFHIARRHWEVAQECSSIPIIAVGGIGPDIESVETALSIPKVKAVQIVSALYDEKDLKRNFLKNLVEKSKEFIK